MSKIVTAINAMLSHPELITNVQKGNHSSELYFLYNDTYKWSINKSQKGVFYFVFYPGEEKLEDMATWPDEAWDDFDGYVSYNSRDLGAKEAHDSLSELYTTVQEKIFGMDQVLDDIIGDMF